MPIDDSATYAWVTVVGDCLDSSQSPARIRHGDKILIRELPVTIQNCLNAIGKIVCLQIGGRLMTKEIVFVDPQGDFLLLKAHNPIEYIPLMAYNVSRLFEIDDVVSKEYAKEHNIDVAML